MRARLLPRTFWMGVATLTVGLVGTPAPARDQPVRACMAAYSGALERQRSGHLREGRELLLECAKTACGALQKKCASGAGQLAADIALITPVVTDDSGAAILDVEVKVDGEPLTTRLDGRELPVDPGVHEVSFSARVGPWPGRAVTTTKTITIEQGQRGAIAVTLAAAPEPAPAAGHADDEAAPGAGKASRPEPSGREAPLTVRRGGGPSAFAYLLGGVGLLGLGAGGLLTYWGKTDNAALAACTPNCQPSSVEHIRQLYLAADASFAAGGAALGVAALLFATSSHVEVQPVHSGAVASFRGVF